MGFCFGEGGVFFGGGVYFIVCLSVVSFVVVFNIFFFFLIDLLIGEGGIHMFFKKETVENS